MNGSPTPRAMAFSPTMLSSQASESATYGPSLRMVFEQLVNPLPVVPVMVPRPPCDCDDDNLTEEENLNGLL